MLRLTLLLDFLLEMLDLRFVLLIDCLKLNRLVLDELLDLVHGFCLFSYI